MHLSSLFLVGAAFTLVGTFSCHAFHASPISFQGYTFYFEPRIGPQECPHFFSCACYHLPSTSPGPTQFLLLWHYPWPRPCSPVHLRGPTDLWGALCPTLSSRRCGPISHCLVGPQGQVRAYAPGLPLPGRKGAAAPRVGPFSRGCGSEKPQGVGSAEVSRAGLA